MKHHIHAPPLGGAGSMHRSLRCVVVSWKSVPCCMERSSSRGQHAGQCENAPNSSQSYRADTNVHFRQTLACWASEFLTELLLFCANAETLRAASVLHKCCESPEARYVAQICASYYFGPSHTWNVPMAMERWAGSRCANVPQTISSKAEDSIIPCW